MRSRALVLSGLVTACALTALGFGCGAFSSDGGSGEGGDAGAGAAEGAAPIVDGGGAPDGDAAMPSTDPGVYCGGSTYCDPHTEVCCTTLDIAGHKGCLPKADASTCLGLTLACDDGADCTGGTVCCSTVSSDGHSIFAASCVPLLDCKKTSFWVALCDPLATGACPGGAACVVPDGGGYGFCELPR
jgi:hypothetical protein